MMLNSISTQSVATSVWGSATRNLTNPTGVWADATRNLTSLGAGVVVLSNTSGTTLAPSTVLDLRPGAGKFRDLTLIVTAGAAGTCQVGLIDGAGNMRAMTTVAATNTGGNQLNGGGATVGPGAKNNDAANNALIYYSIGDWTQ